MGKNTREAHQPILLQYLNVQSNAIFKYLVHTYRKEAQKCCVFPERTPSSSGQMPREPSSMHVTSTCLAPSMLPPLVGSMGRLLCPCRCASHLVWPAPSDAGSRLIGVCRGWCFSSICAGHISGATRVEVCNASRCPCRLLDCGLRRWRIRARQRRQGRRRHCGECARWRHHTGVARGRRPNKIGRIAGDKPCLSLHVLLSLGCIQALCHSFRDAKAQLIKTHPCDSDCRREILLDAIASCFTCQSFGGWAS